jgi:hypothetical protein
MALWVGARTGNLKSTAEGPRMRSCFDCPEAVSFLGYVCAALGRGGAITVARGLCAESEEDMSLPTRAVELIAMDDVELLRGAYALIRRVVEDSGNA